jgi:hypothetical protein
MLLSKINHIGDKHGFYLIEPALVIIGNEDVATMEVEKKKLVILARKMINFQIKLLEGDEKQNGLNWINDNFDRLVLCQSLVTKSSQRNCI